MESQISEPGCRLQRAQIKVCGLTRIPDAVACAELGADAVGLVFYPKSPRHVSDEQARQISRAVGQHMCTVGVFVDEPFSHIMKQAESCGLKAVQLHGNEPPELIERLRRRDLIVIKALFLHGRPGLSRAADYPASAFLVESGKGPLPGGNSMSWNWNAVRDFAGTYPTILAGGLSPDNIRQALSAALADAVDVSSGVELAPGQKDLKKITSFINAVSENAMGNRPDGMPLRRIF